ncbi:hypothetical protein WQE_15431 [Paraburkholderia hospita]|uniref:HNH nuclease domain-containing protein n=1 Tax=Paraburkholderia hospita TaxID=169430 RepID=A0ABN0FNR7_9BURK|nr:HNH endonuclease [Paraburkholderia hospita]EIN00435.1 hypothetical protein WQE_15431 [Paraburkholderia hospita]OUL88446.1 HNH endonuclease [Paraburkholderia hospita]
MKNRYHDNVKRPAFDPAITELLNEDAMNGGSGKPMVVAVENVDGVVYRTIVCDGLQEYLHCVQALAGMGLEDVLKEQLYGDAGVDSRFVVTPAALSTLQAPSTPNTLFDDVEAAASSLAELSETERDSVVCSRVGQGVFRDKLVSYWEECAVTGLRYTPLLRASHVKPWSVSDNRERLDVFNGLLLAPQYDAAFDAGLISFEDTGRIILSPAFSRDHSFLLHITDKARLNPKRIADEHRPYLRHHREHVFIESNRAQVQRWSG